MAISTKFRAKKYEFCSIFFMWFNSACAPDELRSFSSHCFAFYLYLLAFQFRLFGACLKTELISLKSYKILFIS